MIYYQLLELSHPGSVLMPDGLGVIERWVGAVRGGPLIRTQYKVTAPCPARPDKVYVEFMAMIYRCSTEMREPLRSDWRGQR
jgi:hypothetical protein